MTYTPTAKPEPLTDDQLEGALNAQIESSTGFFGDQLSTRRSELFSVYLRHGYTDDAIAAEEDRSTFVDSTCADSVDQILGELIETVMGAETVAEFIPNGPKDERSARQETEAVHNIFFTQNQGYLILQSWLWDGLTLINGYVKAWREERFVVETETYTGQTEASKKAIIADMEADGALVEVVWEEIEIDPVTVSAEDYASSLQLQLEAEEAESREAGSVQVDPETRDVTIVNRTLSFKLKIKRKKASYRIVPVATDEILISSRWDSVDLTGCPFVGHRYLTTESDLISLGFDEEQVRSLPTSEDEEFGDERTTRFDGFDLFESDDRSSVDQSSRNIMVTECYAYIDRDGDGISELVMATLAGADGKLLRYSDDTVAVEEIEEIPIHSWTPFIIPHRHHGESVVERNAPIQRSKTVFQRQLHDNTAFVGNPRTVIGKGGMGNDTLDDMQVYRPGGLVRANDASQVIPMKLPSMVGDIMPVLDRLDDMNEQRTGATRINQGLVSDKFGKQVAGITIAQLRQAGMAKINMIARNFLETGFTSLMRHLHALMRRHEDREFIYRLRGKWVKVDPSQWGARSDVRVSVGLGNEGRMVKAELLREVIGRQVEAITSGSDLADPQRLYNALTDFMDVSGLKNPDRYFKNPETMPPAPEEPEEPSPEQLLAEAQVQVAQQEAETRVRSLVQKETNDARNARLKARELDIKEQEVALRDDRERDKAVLEALTMIGERLSALEARQVVTPTTQVNGSGGEQQNVAESN